MAKPKKGQAKGKQAQLAPMRNPFAFDPIMRKAHVHEETTKAKRKKAKMAMKKALSKREFDGAFSLPKSKVDRLWWVLQGTVSA